MPQISISYVINNIFAAETIQERKLFKWKTIQGDKTSPVFSLILLNSGSLNFVKKSKKKNEKVTMGKIEVVIIVIMSDNYPVNCKMLLNIPS